MKESTAFKLVKDELDRALAAHGSMNSPHEGWAVIKEELDELWEEVKKNQGSSHRGLSEAVQTAATAIRYLIDLCEENEVRPHEEKVERHYAQYVPGSAPSFGSYSG